MRKIFFIVALVRFNEFADERKISSLSLRGKARGLLQEVSAAGAAVDDARLLGERLLWFAGRYPFLLGEQTELTAYRLIDQSGRGDRRSHVLARCHPDLPSACWSRATSIGGATNYRQTKRETERIGDVDRNAHA